MSGTPPRDNPWHIPPRRAGSGAGPHQTRAEAVDQFAVLGREIVNEAVDRFDDYAPLRETGDSTHGVEARLHFLRHADTKLRVVLDLLSELGARRRTARTSAPVRSTIAFVGHDECRYPARLRYMHSDMYRTRASNNGMSA